MTIRTNSRRAFLNQPRGFLTILVCFCLFYVAFSGDLMDPPYVRNNLRRSGMFEKHAVAHETYLSGFPVSGDEPVNLDDEAVAGIVQPLIKTTSIPLYPVKDVQDTGVPQGFLSTTSTIAAEAEDDNARKNQEKINKLMLDMLAAGVGEDNRIDEEW